MGVFHWSSGFGWPVWLASTQEPTCLCTPSSGVIGHAATPGLYVDTGNSNAGPCILPTESSPQLLCSYVFSHVYLSPVTVTLSGPDSFAKTAGSSEGFAYIPGCSHFSPLPSEEGMGMFACNWYIKKSSPHLWVLFHRCTRIVCLQSSIQTLAHCLTELGAQRPCIRMFPLL